MVTSLHSQEHPKTNNKDAWKFDWAYWIIKHKCHFINEDKILYKSIGQKKNVKIQMWQQKYSKEKVINKNRIY